MALDKMSFLSFLSLKHLSKVPDNAMHTVDAVNFLNNDPQKVTFKIKITKILNTQIRI